MPFLITSMANHISTITRRSIGTILHVHYLQLQIIEGFNNPIYSWKVLELGDEVGEKELGDEVGEKELGEERIGVEVAW